VTKRRLSEKIKVGVTIIVGFVIAITVFTGLEYYQYNKDIKNYSEEKLINTRLSYLQFISSDTHKLSSTLLAIAANDEIKENFEKGNKPALSEICSPMFAELKEEYNISYWYFIEPDGTFFFRVNNTGINASKNSGFLFDQIYSNKSLTAGVELFEDKLALRVIYPIFNKEKLIGYIEIGEEIGQFLQLLSNETNNILSISIQKDYISEGQFAAIKNANGNLNSNWSDMENYVNIFQTRKIIYQGQLNLSEIKDVGIFLETIKEGNSFYSKSFFPIYDAAYRKIGGIFVLSNINSIHDNFINKIIVIYTVYLSIFILLGLIIFLIILRINKDLITAKAEAMASAKRAQIADRTKSDFLANMSHEIRTPMNAIMGFSEILRDELENTKCINYIDTIITSSKTLLSLINDILDLSKIEAGKMELQYRPTDAHALFSDIAKIFSIKLKEKGLKLLTDIDGNLPRAVLLDEVRMRQILFNLVGNAVKFTNEGYIELKVKGLYYSDRSKIDLVFSVKDTGIGISEEDKKIIFDAFQQSSGQSVKKYGGTGLGLAITKKLVELMNGEISIDSIVGKGSTFKVIIKEVAVSSIDKSLKEKKAQTESIEFLNQKVLVVDDIESNRFLLKEILNIYGLRFFEAANGKEAIKLASFEHPDIILMDLRMPVMDGYEAIKILKKDPDLKNIPVIVLTASAMKFNEEEIKKLNCEGYIRKPVSRGDLITELKKFLKYTEETEIKIKGPEKSIGDSIFINGMVFKDEDIEKLKKKFPDILDKLQREFLSRIKKLKKELILDDIEDFAREIVNMGEDCELKVLVNHGQKILIQAENFDLDNLSKSLESFEDK